MAHTSVYCLMIYVLVGAQKLFHIKDWNLRWDIALPIRENKNILLCLKAMIQQCIWNTLFNYDRNKKCIWKTTRRSYDLHSRGASECMI